MRSQSKHERDFPRANVEKHVLSLVEGAASGVLAPLSGSRTGLYAPRAKGAAALLDGSF